MSYSYFNIQHSKRIVLISRHCPPVLQCRFSLAFPSVSELQFSACLLALGISRLVFVFHYVFSDLLVKNCIIWVEYCCYYNTKFTIFISIHFESIFKKTHCYTAKILILSPRVFESFVLILFIRKWHHVKLKSIFLFS